MQSTNMTRLDVSIIEGKSAGMWFECKDSLPITVGRDPDSTIVLEDKGVSRNHCLIEKRKDGWYLADAGSTNGTMLNSVLIAKKGDSLSLKRLRSGDVISVGMAALKVELVSDFESVQTDVIEPKLSDSVTTIFLPPARAEAALEKQSEVGSHDQHESLLTVTAKTFGFLVSSRFHQYQLEKKIGEGGIGEVFLARLAGQNGGRRFAIKFLRLDRVEKERDRSRFVREMDISMSLKHPSLIECYESGDHGGTLYLVMEYCIGGNLFSLLKRNGKLTLRRALRLGDRLLAGLEIAHSQNLVHRDLKPSNILLQRDIYGKYHPKISDFGLAKNFLTAGSSGMTADGTIGGSWPYMPREQLTDFRFVAPQSDVWSLAAILYECIAGVLPRPMLSGSDPIQVILNTTVSPITEYVDVPPPICQFFETALAMMATDRYASAVEMRQSLRQAAQSANVEL